MKPTHTPRSGRRASRAAAIAAALEDLALAPSAAGTGGQLSADIAVTQTASEASRHIDLVATRCSAWGARFVVWNGKLLRCLSLGGQAVKRGVLVPIAAFHVVQTGMLELVIASNSGRSVRAEGIAVNRV